MTKLFSKHFFWFSFGTLRFQQIALFDLVLNFLTISSSYKASDLIDSTKKESYLIIQIVDSSNFGAQLFEWTKENFNVAHI